MGSGKSVDVDLTAFFNERMLEMTEKSDTQAIVTVEYTCMGEKRSQEFSMIIPVYGRNSMSWADDRRAAVFVSSKDPAAMFYSKSVTSIVRENMRLGVPQNIQYALGIFNSLSDFGINYVIDPSSAYTDNVGTEIPDFLQFPYQTLSYRGGDCDDLSILMCSLLEAVGIDTAFITIPGHIYMAFNLGLNATQAAEQFGALDNFIVLEDEVWIPLEITVTNEGFVRAWQIGAREWRTAARNGTAALYRMKDSWEIYKPVSVPGAAVTFTMPEKNVIASTFSDGVDTWILREIEEKVDAYKKYIADTGDIKAQNALGAIYGRYGLFDLAEEQLASPMYKGYIPALLNTANVQFAKKNYEEAKSLYRNVVRQDEKNATAYIGIARCCYELEQYTECDLAYQIACKLDEKLSGTYAYLGAFENTKGRAFNLADRIAYTPWVSEDVLGLDVNNEVETQITSSNNTNNNSYVGLQNQLSIVTTKGKVTLKNDSEQTKSTKSAVTQKNIESPKTVETPKATEPKLTEFPKITETPKTVEKTEISEIEKTVEKSKPAESPKIAETPKTVEKSTTVETSNTAKKSKTSKDIKPQKIKVEPLPELSESVESQKIDAEPLPELQEPVKLQKIKVKSLPELPEPVKPQKIDVEPLQKIQTSLEKQLTQQQTAEKNNKESPKILEVPRLGQKGYYVQIGAYKDAKNFANIYNKYKDNYSLVGLEKDGCNVLLVGPLKNDECKDVLNKFKSFGFTDAFVKSF